MITGSTLNKSVHVLVTLTVESQDPVTRRLFFQTKDVMELS